MGNRLPWQQRDISISQLIWYRGNSCLEKQFLCMVARVNKLPWQQDESLYLSHFETYKAQTWYTNTS